MNADQLLQEQIKNQNCLIEQNKKILENQERILADSQRQQRRDEIKARIDKDQRLANSFKSIKDFKSARTIESAIQSLQDRLDSI